MSAYVYYKLNLLKGLKKMDIEKWSMNLTASKPAFFYILYCTSYYALFYFTLCPMCVYCGIINFSFKPWPLFLLSVDGKICPSIFTISSLGFFFYILRLTFDCLPLSSSVSIGAGVLLAVLSAGNRKETLFLATKHSKYS